jgi:hypothetical protein
MTGGSRPAFPVRCDSREPGPLHALDNICLLEHTNPVQWGADFHDDFVPEYSALPQDVQDELQAIIEVLEQLGPQSGRPRVDPLNGSSNANMKEIRFDAADGVWRFAFAFDPNREAILLCGGDKSGVSERSFYRRLIANADKRFDAHVAKIESRRRKGRSSHDKSGPHQERNEPRTPPQDTGARG